jgi:hypothetical protein
MEVYVDDWRWIGVPFHLRAGKALAEGRRTIALGFKEPALKVFPGDVDETCNELVLELTDDPRIFADVRAKVPGPEFRLGRGVMRIDLQEEFPGAEPLQAYERLLLDVMRGDSTLFTQHAGDRAVVATVRSAPEEATQAGRLPARVVGSARGSGHSRTAWLAATGHLAGARPSASRGEPAYERCPRRHGSRRHVGCHGCGGSVILHRFRRGEFSG